MPEAVKPRWLGCAHMSVTPRNRLRPEIYSFSCERPLLWAACKPWHARQSGQDSCTFSMARRHRSTGFSWPSAAEAKIFSARHAIKEGVRFASGIVLAASARTPRNAARGYVCDHSLCVSAISSPTDRQLTLLTNENRLLSFARRLAFENWAVECDIRRPNSFGVTGERSRGGHTEETKV